MLTLKIVNLQEEMTAVASGDDHLHLFYEKNYEIGDHIIIESDHKNIYLILQLDDAIGENFVFLSNNTFRFEVPFGGDKISYSPKSFAGDKHLLTVRIATQQEISTYKNLALNKYDQHTNLSCFPHAVANVETRGEAVFAAKNAINGNKTNYSHGFWPFESWGINQNPDAKLKISFGRLVAVDQIQLTIRADFPHDSWWESLTLTFSDGTTMVCSLIKTEKPQIIIFPTKEIEWLEISDLIKADDPSPFPALTQLQVYGIDTN